MTEKFKRHVKLVAKSGFQFDLEIDGKPFPCKRIEISPFDATEVDPILVKIEFAATEFDIEMESEVLREKN